MKNTIIEDVKKTYPAAPAEQIIKSASPRYKHFLILGEGTGPCKGQVFKILVLVKEF